MEAKKDAHFLLADSLGRLGSLAALLHVHCLLIRLVADHGHTEVVRLRMRARRTMRTNRLDLRRIVRPNRSRRTILERLVHLDPSLHHHMIPIVRQESLERSA